ncbi:MAG: UDP-glucose 4-epimerase GalE [Anaerolineae bacterium]
MRVLVVGGAGYIGSATAQCLLDAGYEVVVFDSLVKGHRAAVPAGAEFVHGDLAHRDQIEDALRRFRVEAVMDFAAFIEAGESMKEPGRYFRNNVCGTLNLLEACVSAGVRRLVFSSTAAVYGIAEEIPITEEAPLHPVNVYGESKLMVERMLEWYGRIYGLRCAALRYFNAAGGRPDRGEDHHPETHLIPLTLQVALGQRPHIAIFGTDYPTPDGTCVRDYIHVDDLASAHVLALRALDRHERLIYNLGNGRGFSVREVIEVCRRVTGHPIPAVETPRRPGDPPVLIASSEKIQRELGWKPRWPSLEDIVASAWEWHRRHPHGYGDG